MFKNMNNSILGIWTAHREGRFILNHAINTDMIALQYVDYNNNVTKDYPHNPNGSDYGIAGLCSKNGRHLGMMPHPERCFLEWQKPIMSNGDKYSVWFRMFRNAYKWCINNY